jgi:hypothetical protein
VLCCVVLLCCVVVCCFGTCLSLVCSAAEEDNRMTKQKRKALEAAQVQQAPRTATESVDPSTVLSEEFLGQVDEHSTTN